MKHLKTTLALFGIVLATIIAFPAHAETEYSCSIIWGDRGGYL